MNKIKYIQELELSSNDSLIKNLGKTFIQSRSERALQGSESTGPEAYLNFKSLQSFDEGVGSESQEDILNSLLLAQRAAEKAFPGKNQLIEWHEKYFEVLSNLGWLFELKEVADFDSSKSLVEIEKVVLDIVAAALTGSQIAVVLKTIEALKDLKDHDTRLIAFEENTHKSENGNFQIGFVENIDGKLSLVSSSYILKTTSKFNKILFVRWTKGTTKLKYYLTKATLNQNHYNLIRKAVKEKLGEDVNNYISSLF